jgi:hypothetical protein
MEGLRERFVKRPHERQKSTWTCTVKIVPSLVQLRFAVQGGKQTAELSHGLGGSQEKKPAGFQGVMKERNNLFLQSRVHIDQQITTTDQIEFGKRRVLDHIVLRKDDHVADAFMDAEKTSVGFLRKVAFQTFR